MVTFHHCNRMSGHEQLKVGKAVSCILADTQDQSIMCLGEKNVREEQFTRKQRNQDTRRGQDVFQQPTSSLKAPPSTFDHLPNKVITSRLYQSVNPLIRAEPRDLIISEKASRQNQGFALLMSQAISTQSCFQGGLPITGRDKWLWKTLREEDPVKPRDILSVSK